MDAFLTSGGSISANIVFRSVKIDMGRHTISLKKSQKFLLLRTCDFVLNFDVLKKCDMSNILEVHSETICIFRGAHKQIKQLVQNRLFKSATYAVPHVYNKKLKFLEIFFNDIISLPSSQINLNDPEHKFSHYNPTGSQKMRPKRPQKKNISCIYLISFSVNY